MSGASGEVKTNMEFPKNIRFLVVDGDTAFRKFIRDELQTLGCKVKACKYKEQALSLLREKKQRFDVVVADVNIPYEMGFKFVEIVSSKMNIPIIMTCSTNDNEITTAGMNFGACKVAVKPVGINDIRRFWQYVATHRRQHLLAVDNSARNTEGRHGQENGSNQGTIEGRLYKNRLVWKKDMEALFVEAVHALGGKDVAAPKQIMELMNVPNLTRENIASHLQNYRLYSDPNYVGGKRKRKAAHAMLVNRMDEQAQVVAHPNCHLLSLEAPKFDPYVPEPSAESMIMQGMAVPEVFGDSRGSSLPAQSSFELQVPSDGIRSEETPTSLDPELESFLAMDLSDPDFPFFDKYLSQGMSMIYGGGLSNGLHDNNYLVGQSETANGDLSALNDRITNDPATDSLIMDNQMSNYPMALQYPLNISPMRGIVDYLNSSGQQQQEQIGGTPLEQPGSFSGLGTSEPSTFGQGTRSGFVWFGPKPPGAI